MQRCGFCVLVFVFGHAASHRVTNIQGSFAAILSVTGAFDNASGGVPQFVRESHRGRNVANPSPGNDHTGVPFQEGQSSTCNEQHGLCIGASGRLAESQQDKEGSWDDRGSILHRGWLY